MTTLVGNELMKQSAETMLAWLKDQTVKVECVRISEWADTPKWQAKETTCH